MSILQTLYDHYYYEFYHGLYNEIDNEHLTTYGNANLIIIKTVDRDIIMVQDSFLARLIIICMIVIILGWSKSLGHVLD